MNFLVHVSLTDDSSGALFQIARPPRCIQIVECHKAVLYIHTCAHFEGTAHQYAHLTGADLSKQFLFPRFCIRLMNEGDLLAGNPSGNQLFADVVIDSKLRLR